MIPSLCNPPYWSWLVSEGSRLRVLHMCNTKSSLQTVISSQTQRTKHHLPENSNPVNLEWKKKKQIALASLCRLVVAPLLKSVGWSQMDGWMDELIKIVFHLHKHTILLLSSEKLWCIPGQPMLTGYDHVSLLSLHFSSMTNCFLCLNVESCCCQSGKSVQCS